MNQEYVTVFEISTLPTNWAFALAGVVPLIIGIAAILGKRRFKWVQPHWLIMPIFCGAFGLLWLCTAGISVLREHSQALTAYQKGDYWLVEGLVTDFHPMPYEGHQDECFSVQDKRFCYSDYDVSPGFHNTSSHGGPIRSGLPVRIIYSGDTILRLEIPKDQVRTPAESRAASKLNEQQSQQRMANNPIEQRMMTAFLFTGVCLTLWWNLQWKRVMQFWLRPPNRPAIQYAFRIFFALNLIGAISSLIQQLQAHPLTRTTVIPTIETTAAMCVVAAILSTFSLWNIERARRKREAKAVAAPAPPPPIPQN